MMTRTSAAGAAETETSKTPLRSAKNLSLARQVFWSSESHRHPLGLAAKCTVSGRPTLDPALFLLAFLVLEAGEGGGRTRASSLINRGECGGGEKSVGKNGPDCVGPSH